MAVDFVIEPVGASVGGPARVCLRDPAAPLVDDGIVGCDGDDSGVVARAGAGALGLYAPLRRCGDVQVRLHRDYLYNDKCLADDGLLVLHRVYGVPAGRCPVLQLHSSGDSAVFATYLAAFERCWSKTRSA